MIKDSSWNSCNKDVWVSIPLSKQKRPPHAAKRGGPFFFDAVGSVCDVSGQRNCKIFLPDGEYSHRPNWLQGLHDAKNPNLKRIRRTSLEVRSPGWQRSLSITSVIPPNWLRCSASFVACACASGSGSNS